MSSTAVSNEDRTRPVRRALQLALAALLSVALVVTLIPTPAYALGRPTKDEALDVLKTYDGNGYFIASTMDERGDDIMVWWDDRDSFDNYDTMVHEECHSYTHEWDADNIYVGGKRSVRVPYTDVFRSKRIAKSVPKKLRSGRFWTYVGKPTANLASDVQGVYGMLNEFAAYCWGFNSTVKLFEYAKDLGGTPDIWRDYVSGSANVAEAYVEFRYFIEHYLYYAKKHDRAVYRGILRNGDFVRAVQKVDARFSKLVKKYDKRFAKIAKMLRKKGYEVEISDGSFMVYEGGSGSGCDLGLDEYNRFVKALNKKKYVKIEKRLGLKHVSKRSPSVGSGGSESSSGSDSGSNADSSTDSTASEEALISADALLGWLF